MVNIGKEEILATIYRIVVGEVKPLPSHSERQQDDWRRWPQFQICLKLEYLHWAAKHYSPKTVCKSDCMLDTQCCTEITLASLDNDCSLVFHAWPVLPKPIVDWSAWRNRSLELLHLWFLGKKQIQYKICCFRNAGSADISVELVHGSKILHGSRLTWCPSCLETWIFERPYLAT